MGGGGGDAAAMAPVTPVLVRRLFERLGATYVKVGQFIASSPTLFPAEYVLEFQKCLDATETTVDFGTIRGKASEREKGGGGAYISLQRDGPRGKWFGGAVRV